ncbi:MAG: FecR family protein [Leptospiraceae bacterium]|nr:FecR family protein [Leptospiraceae bacterium]
MLSLENRNSESLKIIRNNVLVILIAFIFVIIFILDIKNQNPIRDSNSIGKVLTKIKDVERKESKSNVWIDIEPDSRIFNYDTIVTEEISQLSIELNDGTRVHLGENSMIMIHVEKDRIDINFEYGSIKVDSKKEGKKDTKHIRITSDTEVVTIENSVLSINKNSIAKTEVRVEEGVATILTKELQKEISTGQVAKIKSEGKIEIGTEKVKLIEPTSNKYFYTKSDYKEIEFKWKNINSNQNDIIQIFDTKNPSEPYLEDELSSETIKKKLTPGTYSWKVLAKGDEVTSETSQFFIIKVKEPELQKPIKNAIIDLNESMIRFEWNLDERETISTLQISKDESFSNLQQEVSVNSNSTVIEILPEGIYYYRILGMTDLPEYPSLVSEVRKFIVSKKNSIGSIKLISPDEQKKFSLTRKKAEINFSWDSNFSPDSYHFMLSRDDSFRDTIVSQFLKEKFYSQKIIESGIYYWKIKAYQKEKNIDIESKVNSFKVEEEKAQEKEFKLLKPESDFATNDLEEEIIFSWSPAEKKKNYTLEISKDKLFKEKIQHKTSKTKFVWKPEKIGTYYWRVFFENDKKKEISMPRNFEVKKIDSFSILFPKNDSKIDLNEKDEILIEWQKHSSASDYDVLVMNTEKNLEIMNLKSLKENKVLLKDLKKLKIGKFLVVVTANLKLSSGRELYETKKNKFSLILSENVDKSDIKFTSPEEVEQ